MQRKRFDMWYMLCKFSCHEERIFLDKRSGYYCYLVVCSKPFGFFYTLFQKQNSAPRFKSKKNNLQSYITKQTTENIDVVRNKMKLPKVGLVRLGKNREVNGCILNLTVGRNSSGSYFVSLFI